MKERDDSEHFRLVYKVKLIRSLVRKHRISGPLLDVGCRRCDYMAALEPDFERRLGIDYQRAFIEARRSRFDVINAAGEKLPIRKESCGMVLLLETIEHVFDPSEVLKEIATILAPSGYLFLTAPNRFYPFEIHGMRIGARIVSPFFGIPLLSLAPASVRKHVQVARIYTQKSLVRLCEERGLKVLEIEYMPPQFDTVGGGGVTGSARTVVNRLGRWTPVKQMGVSCMLLARKERATPS